MTLADDGFLFQRNKFLREIENAPASDKTKLVLCWSIEEKNFSTAEFHPKKVHYRISVEEISKVSHKLLGHKISKVDKELQRLHWPKKSCPYTDTTADITSRIEFLGTSLLGSKSRQEGTSTLW